jgi:hypothetical protein
MIYDNTYDDYDLTVTSENASYPVVNTQNIHTSRVWRTNSGDLSAQTIVLDAGAGNTFTVDCVALLAHNFTNAATLKFQMNATDAWGGPSIDETLTWRSGIILKFFTAGTYRFVRFSFTDAANTDNYLEVGRIFMSEYLQISPSSRNNFKITNVRTDNTKFAISGEPYSDVGFQYRIFEYDFPPSGFTMISSLRTVWATVGKHKPFVFLNFDTRYTEIEPAYVMWVKDFDETYAGYNKIGYTLNLREVT